MYMKHKYMLVTLSDAGKSRSSPVRIDEARLRNVDLKNGTVEFGHGTEWFLS